MYNIKDAFKDELNLLSKMSETFRTIDKTDFSLRDLIYTDMIEFQQRSLNRVLKRLEDGNEYEWVEAGRNSKVRSKKTNRVLIDKYPAVREAYEKYLEEVSKYETLEILKGKDNG